ncbi:hypothetical protein KCU65_g463, partial [Aureobasidium melanogenum]
MVFYFDEDRAPSSRTIPSSSEDINHLRSTSPLQAPFRLARFHKPNISGVTCELLQAGGQTPDRSLLRTGLRTAMRVQFVRTVASSTSIACRPLLRTPFRRPLLLILFLLWLPVTIYHGLLLRRNGSTTEMNCFKARHEQPLRTSCPLAPVVSPRLRITSLRLSPQDISAVLHHLVDHVSYWEQLSRTSEPYSHTTSNNLMFRAAVDAFRQPYLTGMRYLLELAPNVPDVPKNLQAKTSTRPWRTVTLSSSTYCTLSEVPWGISRSGPWMYRVWFDWTKKMPASHKHAAYASPARRAASSKSGLSSDVTGVPCCRGSLTVDIGHAQQPISSTATQGSIAMNSGTILAVVSSRDPRLAVSASPARHAAS